jgi:glycosyltransferase involved in cell wall biosynthesis
MNQGAIFDAARVRGKRILIVSAYLPPYAPFGTIRIPALAQYWLSMGADVRIIAAKTALFSEMDPMPLAAERIAFVGFGGAAEPAPLQGAQSAYKAWIAQRFPVLMERLRYCSLQWRDFILVPDPFLPWVSSAVRHGVQWCTDWKPDLIYSSGPPHSGHLVAKALKQHFKCPWLAELRDPWSSNPYYHFAKFVQLRNQMVERQTLRTADALVATTRAEQKILQSHYAKPVVYVSNGFLAADAGNINMMQAPRNEIIITHAGALYGGRRDPRTLLDALRLLGADATQFRLKLIGEPEMAAQLIQDYPELKSQIDIMPQMSREDVLKIYGETDVLLLLRWDDPLERNFVAGKIFEYIAARRPILCLGDSQGEAADIIRDNGLGFVAQSTEEAAFALRGFLETKKRLGSVPLLPESHTLAFTRESQFAQLDRFIDSLSVAAQTHS